MAQLWHVSWGSTKKHGNKQVIKEKLHASQVYIAHAIISYLICICKSSVVFGLWIVQMCAHEYMHAQE